MFPPAIKTLVIRARWVVVLGSVPERDANNLAYLQMMIFLNLFKLYDTKHCRHILQDPVSIFSKFSITKGERLALNVVLICCVASSTTLLLHHVLDTQHSLGAFHCTASGELCHSPLLSSMSIIHIYLHPYIHTYI